MLRFAYSPPFKYVLTCVGCTEVEGRRGLTKSKKVHTKASKESSETYAGAHQGVVQRRTLLRRVLRRVLETASERVLKRVRGRRLAVGFNGKKGSEKGS